MPDNFHIKVQIEEKAKPCPGVERAIHISEDALGKGENVYTIGHLIHNSREVQRLEQMGLNIIKKQELSESKPNKRLAGKTFMIRTHGESEQIVNQAKDAGMAILDCTCPIVRHSQELVSKYVREGWKILLAGKPDHPEIIALLDRCRGNGAVVYTKENAETVALESRTVLIGQTTIHPDKFLQLRKILSSRLPDIKILDTTCRFIRNRQQDMKSFGKAHDCIVLVGGKDSSNCRLLYETLLDVNANCIKAENPFDLDNCIFNGHQSIGITGGASTPLWQLDEMKVFIEETLKKNPKGLKNTKGGKRIWQILKSQKKPV